MITKYKPEPSRTIAVADKDGQSQRNNTAHAKLKIMKFGGTSVGDEICIARVVQIIQAASRESRVVVVVSAMAGVTNKLIEAALRAEAGALESVRVILQDLRNQHDKTAAQVIHSVVQHQRIARNIDFLFQETERLCNGAALLRELSPRTRDAISSIGERLSAPLIAAALAEAGVAGEAIEASELVVTDSYHGAADPQMEPTRERCEARLLPMLRLGTVPVVTGFIGATSEGVLTTLGRGGSDYSATIIGAALRADEIVIWTDVDGLMTADPRLVSGTRTVPELSYREATELAYFGAKVLHPKTLSAVVQHAIPVWIRNTFAPDLHGTKITPKGNGGGIKALGAVGEATLIRLGGPGMTNVSDALARTFAATAALRVDVLLISQSTSQKDICLVVASSAAKRTVEALRREFSKDLEPEQRAQVRIDSTVAMLAVVGHDMEDMSTIAGRTFGALSQENVKVIAIAQGSSECVLSFVVSQRDLKAALITAHREFQLGVPHTQAFAVKSPNAEATTWYYGSDRPSANAD